MAARHSIAILLSFAAFSALPAVSALAQDAAPPTPEVANSKFNFSGTINADSVYVRSGPGDNYYPTSKLGTGANVTVVGMKFDWLKIVPPPGSYSYVAKAYVTKTGEGKGVVDKGNLNVRAGSDLNEMKTTVQTKLDQGVDVKILGEKDEYWKIAPPAGTYLYVKQQFVTPGKPLPVANIPADAATGSDPIVSDPIKAPVADAGTTTPPVQNSVTPTPPVTPAADGGVATADATPSTQPVADAGPTTPATQPVATSATAQFDKLEAEFAAFSNNPLEEQPLADAQTRYEALKADTTLPESMRRIVDIRLSVIKTRVEAREQFLAVKETQKKMEERQLALKAEKDELLQRIEKNKVTVYAAVGTLRTSSLQGGAQMLYRLTDPATGRTLVYIRTDDTKYATLIGQFIGVKGDVVNDTQMQLKFVSPTEAAVVDPATIGNGVTAQLIPSSIVEKQATATLTPAQ